MVGTAKSLGVTFGIFLRECAAQRDAYIMNNAIDGDDWIQLRRARDLLPGWLRPVARWAAGRFTSHCET